MPMSLGPRPFRPRDRDPRSRELSGWRDCEQSGALDAPLTTAVLACPDPFRLLL